ncbi:MAG: hypothetical protein KY394_04610 [Actinobacteria bacterium]|nr:hypothetical protein [Actinomycetota bacterium]
MADDADRGIAEKLGIEPGMTVVILHEPNYFRYELGDLPDRVTVHRDSFEQPADLFLIFAARPAEAERGLQRVLTVLPPNGAVWIAWERDPPNGPGELDEDVLRDLFEDTGMVDDRSGVINDTWQGLRFVVAEENRDDWEKVRPESPLRE